MIRLPVMESSCSHHGGDLSHVAAWLLDRLDLEPPQAGGSLNLYLCYHPDDISYFVSAQRNHDLARALLTAYRRERKWDGLGFGDLRFDLAEGSHPAHISLERRRDGAPPASGSGKVMARKGKSLPTPVEFNWYVTDTQVTPGTLGLIRRWTQPLMPETLLVATMTILSGASIARHIDLWQHSIRWYQPVIYLPRGQTDLLIGAMAGCDLDAPTLQSPLVVAYDYESDEWTWTEVNSGWRRRRRGRAHRELNLEWPGDESKGAVSLSGSRLPTPRMLNQQEAENRLPMFTLEIIGCVLPFSGGEGYGRVPDDFPSILAADVRSAINLPGDGGWIYLDKRDEEAYLLRRGENPPGQRLAPGSQFRVGSFEPGKPRTGLWTVRDGNLPKGFRGEVQLTPPLRSMLACGSIAENVPDSLFAGYKDSAHGRAPVRLMSPSGRHYKLIFNQAAKHPVILLTSDSPEGLVYKPDTSVPIELGSGAEFILGTTHYRLRCVSEQANDHAAFTPSTVSAGGAS